MSAINFPDPSQSPWTNSSTGITYTYSNGVWKALSSEEVFLKESDAESTYLKQADANFVSLSDGGTQQVISGGGGLNVDGDVQKKGNTVPSAVMGVSAPSNPGICDFWTDTSGDDPVLKSWNGTEWVEVGSSGVVTSELPQLPTEVDDTDILSIERGGVQYKVSSLDLVPLSGAIHTPVEVLTPLDGAGVGGDKTYTPMTNTISATSKAMLSNNMQWGYGDQQQHGVSYGNGYFMVTAHYKQGDQYRCIRTWDSNNPSQFSNWQGRTAVFEWNDYPIYDSAYGAGVWVAITGTAAGSSMVQYSNSTDASSAFQLASFPNYNGYNGRVEFANGLFVMATKNLSSTYNHRGITTSSDGANWTARTTPRGNWTGIAYGNGKWVVVGDSNGQSNATTKIMYSTDAITWTAASAPHSSYGDVAYGEPNGQPMFVATRNDSGGESSTNCVAYSTDGINWTSANSLQGKWNNIVYGDGKFVALNGGYSSPYRDYVKYSTDGINWSSAQTPFYEYRGLAYGNGWFVASGPGSNNSQLIASQDGINWYSDRLGLTMVNNQVLDSSDSSLITDATLPGVFPQLLNVVSDSNSSVTGQVYSHPTDGSMILTNTAGDWTVGMKVVSTGTVTSYAPSPSQITFTSENAGTTAASATGTTLLSRVWTLETRASDSDPWTVEVEYEDFSIASSQDGATEWTTGKPTIQPNTQYRVKVKYKALGARSKESTYHTFTTGDL